MEVPLGYWSNSRGPPLPSLPGGLLYLFRSIVMIAIWIKFRDMCTALWKLYAFNVEFLVGKSLVS